MVFNLPGIALKPYYGPQICGQTKKGGKRGKKGKKGGKRRERREKGKKRGEKKGKKGKKGKKNSPMTIDYSPQDFDAPLVANQLISQSGDLPATTAQLAFAIETHKREIHSHVMEHQDLLLDQIKDLDHLANVVRDVALNVKNITATYNKISHYVTSIYDEMTNVQKKLHNIQLLSQSTRKVSRFINIYQRSISLMEDGPEEYPNVATHLAELDVIEKDVKNNLIYRLI
jgi:hypothetical protein